MLIQIILMIVNNSFAWCPNAVRPGRRFLFHHADANRYPIIHKFIKYFFIFILGEQHFL